MSNDRTISTAAESNMETTSVLKDFLALIKIGIVNSNMITTFTGLFLAFQFTGRNFLHHIDLLVYALGGSGLIIAGSAALNNLIDRDIDPIMSRTKSRPTVTGRFKASSVWALAFTFIVVGEDHVVCCITSSRLFGDLQVSSVMLYSIRCGRNGDTLVTQLSVVFQGQSHR